MSVLRISGRSSNTQPPSAEEAHRHEVKKEVEEEGPEIGTQVNLDDAMDAAKQEASAEGQTLAQAIRQDKDPSATALKKIKEAKIAAFGDMRHVRDWGQLGNDVVDEKFAQLAKQSYHADELAKLFKLVDLSPEMKVTDHFENVFKEHFVEVLKGSATSPELAEKLRSWPLKAMADRWTAQATARVARAYGLQGEVLHSLYQGKTRFFCAGQNADITVSVVQDTDNTWDMAAHRCGCWLIGFSGVGKDNALAALRIITNYAMDSTKAQIVQLKISPQGC